MSLLCPNTHSLSDKRYPTPPPDSPPTTPLPPAWRSLLHGIYLGFGPDREFPDTSVRDALSSATVSVTYWVRFIFLGISARTEYFLF